MTPDRLRKIIADARSAANKVRGQSSSATTETRYLAQAVGALTDIVEHLAFEKSPHLVDCRCNVCQLANAVYHQEAVAEVSRG